MNRTYFIGLSVTFHDPAIAILDPAGKVLFAEATERYLQLKRALNCEPDSLYQITSLLKEYCPDAEALEIGFNWRRERPFYEHFCSATEYFTGPGLMRARFAERKTFLEKYKIFHMLGCQSQAMAAAGIHLARRVREDFPRLKLNFQHFDHHLSHAAFACFASPFSEAQCLVVDSFGEHGSLAFYHYRDGRLRLIRAPRGIESLGFFYMKLTELCSFDWMKGEEWKVMGLAPYGSLNPEIYHLFQAMIQVDELGLQQNLSELRRGMAILEDQYRGCQAMQATDLAFTGQYFFAELVSRLLKNFRALGFSENLVLCGGCALNSSMNGQLLARTGYKNLYVPPAPADDGTALGAAVLAYDRVSSQPRSIEPHAISPYLGSEISEDALSRLIRYGKGFQIQHLPENIEEHSAQLIAQGKLLGWMQGRAEFGPRALGNRSILADPRDPEMKQKINAKVKFREEFRPFAPSVLHEFGEQYFENYVETPYMERALRFRPEVRDRVPAVVHIDQSGRLQSVKFDSNPRFYRLIQSFHRISGVPIVLNTSFNMMGKPIIHCVEDAVGVFLTTGLDALAIGDYLISKPI